MRTITDHIVEGDSANHQLKIEVIDEPGAGGANHEYLVSGFGHDDPESVLIKFQNGPIKEAGVNGLTHEALLAIVMDRLNSFQDGPFTCTANACALEHIGIGLQFLQNRTKERIARGVEGELVK